MTTLFPNRLLVVMAFTGCLLSIAGAESARAELPSIRFDRLTPLGASAGATVEVEIAGADIEDVRTLLFDHPGFSAEPVEGKERLFRIHVAGDVPPGTYDVRLMGRWGVSNPRLFAIDHGLTDVTETEPNNEASQAQQVQINTAIAAMSDGNNQDVFRFPAKAGQRIVIDCQAGKLDSMMDATMSLASAQGKLLASSSDHNGRDPLIDFVAPADGDYLVHVYDLSYRGGYPYRLRITDRPYVENVFPRAVQAGQTVELTAIGRNLGEGATELVERESELPYFERKLSFKAPDDIASAQAYRFIEHPTDYSVLPTAATCTLTGVQFQPFPDSLSNAQTLLVSDVPTAVENEPNDVQNQAQPVTLPLVISGRFDRPRDADWYEFEVAEAGQYGVDVYCERINGHADPYLVLVDDKGNRVNEFDDFGHRMNAFDGHLRDPVGMVNLNAKQKYRVLVQDRYRRGGASYQYVLAIKKQQPDFYAAVIHSQNPGPSGTTVWKGGSVYLDVVVHQQHGYNEEITITAENLPPGLHVEPTTFNNSHGVLVLWADDDAADFAGPITLIATGKRGDEVLRREVRPYTRVWTDAGMNSSRPTRQLMVAIRDGAPFRLEWVDSQIAIEAGKQAIARLRLVRRWDNFKDNVTVQPLAFPGNFQLSNAAFAGDQTELSLPITVQNGTRPGQYTLAVLGQAQVPFNKDPAVQDRPNTLVSLPSRPLRLTVSAPAK